MTEDEMVGWHQGLNRHEFEHVLRVGDGQGSLACQSPWGCKELDITEQLNCTDMKKIKWSCERKILCIFVAILATASYFKFESSFSLT